MKHILLAAVIASFASGSAMAQSCANKAVGSDGKPLAGAAKTSFMKSAAMTARSAARASRCPGLPRPAS